MDAQAAVRLLLEGNGRDQRPLPPARYVPLQAQDPGPVHAVDGSHAVLVDNGAVWVVATRSAAIRWPGLQRELEPELHACRAEEAQALLDAAYARHGLEPPRAGSAAAWAEAWRGLREHEAALRAVADAQQGSLVLVDGALVGLPPLAQAMADRLRNAAARHALRLVGVSKRSGLERGGVPLVGHLHAHGPAGAWSVEVEPGVHVARLHGQAPCAFRVDATDGASIGALLPLARDAVYAGYPYPLAVAHNQVALTAGVVAELKARLALEARRVGGSEAARLFADFHEVLDRNVPG
ncbi:MAG TPA: hypothetical protein VM286_06395 [Candidatus Thermoplasmatota archaeon]|nr:hypothetical protein [Candidatus Thermoplasmatota archaeon]